MNLKSKARVLLTLSCVSTLMNFGPVFANKCHYYDVEKNRGRMKSCGVILDDGRVAPIVDRFLRGRYLKGEKNGTIVHAIISYIFQEHACKKKYNPDCTRVKFIPKSEEELTPLDRRMLDALCDLWLNETYAPALPIFQGNNILHYVARYGSEYVASKLLNGPVGQVAARWGGALSAKTTDGEANTPLISAGNRANRGVISVFRQFCPNQVIDDHNARGRNVDQSVTTVESRDGGYHIGTGAANFSEFVTKMKHWFQYVASNMHIVDGVVVWNDGVADKLSNKMDKFLNKFVAKYKDKGGINAINQFGNTLLHSIISSGLQSLETSLPISERAEVMKMFIKKLAERGINPGIRNNLFYTAFSYKQRMKGVVSRFRRDVRAVFRSGWVKPIETACKSLEGWVKEEDRKVALEFTQKKMDYLIAKYDEVSSDISHKDYMGASILLTAAAKVFVLDRNDMESFNQFVEALFDQGLDDTACILYDEIPQECKDKHPDYKTKLDQALSTFIKVKVERDCKKLKDDGTVYNRSKDGDTILHKKVRDFLDRESPCGPLEEPDDGKNWDALVFWCLQLKGLESGFDFNATNEKGLTALDLMAESPEENDEMLDYWAELCGCKSPHERFEEEIRDKNINDPGDVDAEGGTLLHAIINRCKDGRISKIRLLRCCGWLSHDYDVDLEKKDKDQLTACDLLKKAFPDDKELQLRFEYVLQYGFELGISKADDDRSNRRLLRRGVRRNRDDIGETSGRSPAFNYLCERLKEEKDVNAPANIDDPDGGTLWHWAIRHYLGGELDDEELLLYCKMLLSRGLDGSKNTTITDEEGNSFSVVSLFSDSDRMRSHIKFICEERSLAKCKKRTEEELERVRSQKPVEVAESDTVKSVSPDLSTMQNLFRLTPELVNDDFDMSDAPRLSEVARREGEFSGAFMELMSLLGQAGNINDTYKDAFGGTLLHLAVHWYAQDRGLTDEELIDFLKLLIAHKEFKVDAKDSKGACADECLEELCREVIKGDKTYLCCRFRYILRSGNADVGENMARQEIESRRVEHAHVDSPAVLQIAEPARSDSKEDMVDDRHDQNTPEVQIVCETPNKMGDDMNSDRVNSPNPGELDAEAMKELREIDLSNVYDAKERIKKVVRWYYQWFITPECFGKFCLGLKEKGLNTTLGQEINDAGLNLRRILEDGSSGVDREETIAYVRNIFKYGLEKALEMRENYMDFDAFDGFEDELFTDNEDDEKSDDKSPKEQPAGKEDDKDSIDLFDEEDDKLLMGDSDEEEDELLAIIREGEPEKKKSRKD